MSGSVKSLEEAFGAIEKTSAESVSKTAEALFKAKPTVVAVGDLAVLPYAYVPSHLSSLIGSFTDISVARSDELGF